MKQNWIIFRSYFLFWLLFFVLAKVFFLFYHSELSTELSWQDLSLVLLHGGRLDLSTVGYYVAIPSLLLALFAFSQGKFLSKIINIYTLSILCISLTLILFDVELYRHWGFRLDSTLFTYLKSPKEATGSSNSTVVLQLFLVWLVALFAFWKLYQIWIGRKIKQKTPAKWYAFPVLLFLTAALILPIRGSLGVAPMNVGFVFFHKSQPFANHAAINPIWNLGHDLVHKSTIGRSDYFDSLKTKQHFEELFVNQSPDSLATHLLKKDSLNPQNPNVFIIILEGYASQLLEPLDGIEGVSPNLNALCKEGVLFSNIYASGNRTHEGLLAVLNGYPAAPTTSIIQYSKKSEKLTSLSQIFNKKGYNTSMVLGGDLNFMNFRSYFTQSKFQSITNLDDFPMELRGSKWGVHDHYVFDKLFEETQQDEPPFFKVMLTSSSHEPFDVPMERAIEGEDDKNKFLNSAYYTDKSLGDFIQKAKKEDWWENSLLIVVADHGVRYVGGNAPHLKERHTIPMLWLGGALAVQDTVITTFGSQNDLAQTLIKQLEVEENPFVFSRNLLAKDAKSFGFYTFRDGFGYVSPENTLIYDNISQNYIEKTGKYEEKDLEYGRSIMQSIYNDFNAK
jgi:phosphoglycerol transferase MdoB-like AlkP superfamily enzyme